MDERHDTAQKQRDTEQDEALDVWALERCPHRVDPGSNERGTMRAFEKARPDQSAIGKSANAMNVKKRSDRASSNSAERMKTRVRFQRKKVQEYPNGQRFLQRKPPQNLTTTNE